MKTITCVSTGIYGDNLTRGRLYESVAEDNVKGQIRVRLDGGRLRWFPASCFDVTGQPVSTLTLWQFDDKIVSDEQSWLPDVSLTLSDGTRRWCFLATPQSLQRLLQDRVAEPYLWAAHMVVVQSYAPEVVEEALRYLDEQGELAQATKPVERVAYSDDPADTDKIVTQ